jgi:hypothetical protein
MGKLNLCLFVASVNLPQMKTDRLMMISTNDLIFGQPGEDLELPRATANMPMLFKVKSYRSKARHSDGEF